MTGEVALKACAERLLASADGFAKLPQEKAVAELMREAAALLLTRSSGWQDERKAACETALEEIHSIAVQAEVYHSRLGPEQVFANIQDIARRALFPPLPSTIR